MKIDDKKARARKLAGISQAAKKDRSAERKGPLSYTTAELTVDELIIAASKT